MSKIKHYKKPSHRALDKEDKELMDKKAILKEDKQFRKEEGFIGRILRLRKKARKSSKSKSKKK